MIRMVGTAIGRGVGAGRIARARVGQSMVGEEPVVVIYDELPRLETLVKTLQRGGVNGLILPPCSAYSHLGWALSYYDLPTLVFKSLPAVTDGVKVWVDCIRGCLWIPENDVERVELERFSLETLAPTEYGRDGGAKCKVMAQIQSPEDVLLARDLGADGVGEIKAELLESRVDGTSALERIVSMIRKETDWETIPVRFFDFDAEKLRKGLGVRGADGTLQKRGVRIIEEEAWLARYFMRVVEEVGARGIVVVLPMVTVKDEVAGFRDLAGEATRIGIQVETPAAAIMIEEFLEVVDYVEIGINDLTQYTMAWDRRIPHSRYLPERRLADAVARLVRNVTRDVSARNAFSTVALDLLPTSELAAQLADCGVNCVTVSPRRIATWRACLDSAIQSAGSQVDGESSGRRQ